MIKLKTCFSLSFNKLLWYKNHKIIIFNYYKITKSCLNFLETMKWKIIGLQYLIVCLFVWWCLSPLSTIFQLYRGRSVLLVEETGGLWEKTTDLSQVTDKLYHIMFYTSPWSRFELTTSVVIGTDCIGICKSNYHVITTNDSPFLHFWQKTWQKYNNGRIFYCNIYFKFFRGKIWNKQKWQLISEDLRKLKGNI
jgi:hypothetical protein